MRTFEIKEDFLLDGKPIKLISGAIHYFRMTPQRRFYLLPHRDSF